MFYLKWGPGVHAITLLRYKKVPLSSKEWGVVGGEAILVVSLNV